MTETVGWFGTMPQEPWHPGNGAKPDCVIQLSYGEVHTHASYKTTRTWDKFNSWGTAVILLSDELYLGHSKSNHLIPFRFPWWSSQIFLKFDGKDPFCNRNEPWKFQLFIISCLKFICHWSLCNFPIFRWSWVSNLFLTNLSDNNSLKFCSA